MKHLVGKKITEKVDFMGDSVEVKKLTVSEVFDIQDLIKRSQDKKDKYDDVALIKDVIRLAVIGAEEITDEEFNDFPIGELTTLSSNVMSIAGLANEVGN
jgi:hypothetical protein